MGFARIACPKAPDYLAMILRQEWQTIREHSPGDPRRICEKFVEISFINQLVTMNFV
jgi:hypothetical protein